MPVDGLPEDWFCKPPNPKFIHDVATWRDFVARRNTHPNPTILARSDYEALTPSRRRMYNLARKVLISNLPKHDTPMADEARLQIETTLSVNTFNEDPGPKPGIFLSANSGLGKSTLVRDIIASYDEDLQALKQIWTPDPGEPDDLNVPVVWINMPAKVTIRNICKAIIEFYGDEYRVADTETDLTKKVKRLIADCGTKVIVLDDITRLKMHREADQDASDWIRSMQESGATIVGIGINVTQTGLLYEGQVSTARRDLLTQTRRRFTVHPLRPFTYDTTQEANDWVAHLHAVEQDLPLIDKREGMLTDENMPEYLFERTQGVIGSLSKLITETSTMFLNRAPAKGGENLTEADFDQVRLDHAAEGDGDEPAEPRAARTPKTPAKRKSNGVYGKSVRGAGAA